MIFRKRTSAFSLVPVLPVLGFALFALTSSTHRAGADTISLAADADASVLLSGAAGTTSANRSETNYGLDQTLQVSYNTFGSGGGNAKSYIRFDLGNLQPSSISGASLNLYTNTAGYTANNVFNIYGLRDGYAGVDNTGNGLTTDDPDIHGQNWPENVIDWNSAPANLLTSANSSTLAAADRNKFTSDAIFLGQLTVDANAPTVSPVSFSSATLQNFLQSDTDHLVTLMIANDRETFFSFLSKEAIASNGMSYGPQLVLQAQPVPEPSTYAMMGLGIGALACISWKRKRSSSNTLNPLSI